mgnify:FL=1
MIRVGDIAEQIRGVTFAKSDAVDRPMSGYSAILRAGNIQDTGLQLNDLLYVPTERISAKQFVRENDVLIAASSGSIDVVGKSARILSDFDGGFGAFLKVLRPSTAVDPSYFAHFFRTRRYRQTVSALAAGANINNLKNEHLDELMLPTPPLKEQRRIAVILDQAEKQRIACWQAMSPLTELTQQQYDGYTAPYSARSIGDLVNDGALLVHKDGNHGSLYPRADEFGSEGVPFITAKAIREDGTLDASRIDYLNAHKARQLKIGWIQDNDVLLSHNASVGKVGLYDGAQGPALIGTSLTSFRVDPTRLEPEYLLASLTSPHFQHQLHHDMAQTTRNQVPITAQRKLTVPWAPIDAQRGFVSKARQIKKVATLLRERAVASDELFDSLQSRAFRGEL